MCSSTALNTATGSETNATDILCGPGSSSEDQEKATNETAATPASLPRAPDGGLQAWLQVLGGFFIYFNTW